MEPSTVLFIFAGLFLCIGVYKIATNYTKESRDISGQIQNLQLNKFSTDMNRFAAKKEMAPSSSRTALATQLASEATAITELGTAQAQVIEAEDKVANAPARLAEVREKEEAIHSNEVTLLNEASNRKVSPEILDGLRVNEEASKLRVNEHRELKEIEKEAYLFEKEIEVKGAIIARITPVYEVQLLMDQLQKVLLDRENWLAMPDSKTKKEMVSQLNRNVKMLREAINAKGQGLIQGNSRPELGSMDES